MHRSLVRAAGATIAVMVLLPAFASGSRARGGTFTSIHADVHVARGGATIKNADINCKLQHGVGTAAIDFNAPIAITKSGAFTYQGTAIYLSFTGSGYKSRMTTASLSGTFVGSKRVKGTVKGGPGACSSVKFAATYNPRAH